MAFKVGDKVVVYRNNPKRTRLPNKGNVGRVFTVSGAPFIDEWIPVRDGVYDATWYFPASYLKHVK